MILIQTILAFLVVLGILVVVHELGHYLVARWCGVKVLRFSVGMGKVIWSRRFGPDQTEWAVSALPLGGYVKMLDARDQEQGPLSEQDRKREFTGQNVWRRIAIVAAGPLANFLLAIAIFAGLYSYGMPEPVARLRAVPEQSPAGQAGLRGGDLVKEINGKAVQTWSELRWALLRAAIAKTPAHIVLERPNPDTAGAYYEERINLALPIAAEQLEGDFLGHLGLELARPPALIGRVVEDGPAARGGLMAEDAVLSVNGAAMHDGLAFVELVRASPGQSLSIEVLRGGRPLQLTVVPERVEADGQSIGRIQAEVPLRPEMISVSVAPLQALWRGTERTWETTTLTLKMLGRMLTGEASLKNITGPITIADYAGQTARIGMISFLSFIAFISISLGIMNLLPIPVLDGGLLLYYSLEVITGRPVSERFGEIAQRAGLFILMALMMVAVFNDIVRLVS